MPQRGVEPPPSPFVSEGNKQESAARVKKLGNGVPFPTPSARSDQAGSTEHASPASVPSKTSSADDVAAAIRAISDVACFVDEAEVRAFALSKPGECRPLSVSELRKGVERDAVPGLRGDLGTAGEAQALLDAGHVPCVHLGLHSAYVAVLRVPDALGKEALDEVLSCKEVRYAERASDGAATNAFLFGLDAFGPKIEGDVDLFDLRWLRRWQADDGREVILNGWVELTGESVSLAEGRAGSIDEVIAAIGRDEARRHDPPQFRGQFGIPRLTQLCVRDLEAWGKGPTDYRGDRSAHDMACCGRAAWYLDAVLRVGLSSREMVEVVATSSRTYLRDRGLDRDKYETMRSGVTYLWQTASKAVAWQADRDVDDGNGYRRRFTMPDDPGEDDVFPLLYELRRLGGSMAALVAAANVVFPHEDGIAVRGYVEAAMRVRPADGVVPDRTRQLLEDHDGHQPTDYAKQLGKSSARRIIAAVDMLDLDVDGAALVAQAVIDSHECLRAIGWGMRDTEREIERILRIHGIDYAYQRPGGDCE